MHTSQNVSNLAEDGLEVQLVPAGQDLDLFVHAGQGVHNLLYIVVDAVDGTI